MQTATQKPRSGVKSGGMNIYSERYLMLVYIQRERNILNKLNYDRNIFNQSL